MNKTRKELFLQGKLYSPIQGGRCHICFSSLWILLFYGYIYIYIFLHSFYSIHTLLPPEIRLSGAELEMRGSLISPRPRSPRLGITRPRAARGYRMLMQPPVCMYSHVSSLQMCNTFITEAVPFSHVQHPSMIIRRDGPMRRAACEKGTEGEDRHY